MRLSLLLLVAASCAAFAAMPVLPSCAVLEDQA